MIWLTWRQFRTQAALAAAGVAALAVLLAATGPHLAGLYDAAGPDLMHQITGADQTVYFVGGLAVLLLPALIGMFWGAPLIASELESGTHHLAWNQGTTRTRWLLSKLSLTGLAAMTATGLASLAVTWWSNPIDQAVNAGGSDNTDNFLPRIDPVTFGARGIVPLGYALFAFLLGVTLGVMIRRTVPAMGATLAAFAAVQITMPLWIRPHLATPVTTDIAFTPGTLANYGISSVSHVDIGKPGAWVTTEHTLNASGQTASRMPTTYADCDSIKACAKALADAGYHQRVTYQPASNFWALQWAEAGIYLGLTAAATALCVWWVHRRTV
ncbi:transporter [Streptomyces sp. NPDC087300]|uniref:transporter n=1 Tax=Streptomyces sp. NPDC087300 TaxID=3365780 RepID=UPI003818730C